MDSASEQSNPEKKKTIWCSNFYFIEQFENKFALDIFPERNRRQMYYDYESFTTKTIIIIIWANRKTSQVALQWKIYHYW